MRRAPRSIPGWKWANRCGDCAELDGEPRTQALLCAEAELQAAIATGSPTAQHYLELGSVRELIGKLPLAIASYSDGLGTGGDDVRLHNQRGWAYVSAGKADLARADFAERCELIQTIRNRTQVSASRGAERPVGRGAQ